MGFVAYSQGVERLETGPHTAPRTAVVWAVLRTELARATGPLAAVDVGGGTGGFAVPLARDGHRVTVVDSSPDALAALTRRAADAGVADRVEAVQGDADDLSRLLPAECADLVLCHSVLEMVDDPGQTASALAACLRPGGAVSLVVANQVAAVLAKAMTGHLRSALNLLRQDGPVGEMAGSRVRRRFAVAEATRLLEQAGLVVESVHGVRILADLIPGSAAEADLQALVEFELAAAELSPYRDIATQLHLLARKR